MMKQSSLFIISLFVLVGFSYGNNATEEATEKVKETLEQSSNNVNCTIPEGQDEDEDELPSMEKVEKKIKENCLRYGTNESFDRLMDAKKDLETCLSSQLNYTDVKLEVEEAKVSGDLRSVFRKYCRKWPIVRNCVLNFTEPLETCINPEQRDEWHTFTNITDAFFNFICFKDGERIALFIEEGGLFCVASRQEEISQCINSTSAFDSTEDQSNSKDAPSTFKFGPTECAEIKTTEKCVVSQLETCAQPTPANIVDSMFKFIKKVTPCQQYEETLLQANSDSTSANVTSLN